MVALNADSEYWRKRAAAARSLADDTTDVAIRQIMLDVARTCDEMAEQADKKAVRR